MWLRTEDQQVLTLINWFYDGAACHLNTENVLKSAISSTVLTYLLKILILYSWNNKKLNQICHQKPHASKLTFMIILIFLTRPLVFRQWSCSCIMSFLNRDWLYVSWTICVHDSVVSNKKQIVDVWLDVVHVSKTKQIFI